MQYPIGTGVASAQSVFKAAVKTLDESVGLGMIRRRQ
jgi:hypothetical protein